MLLFFFLYIYFFVLFCFFTHTQTPIFEFILVNFLLVQFLLLLLLVQFLLLPLTSTNSRQITSFYQFYSSGLLKRLCPFHNPDTLHPVDLRFVRPLNTSCHRVHRDTTLDTNPRCAFLWMTQTNHYVANRHHRKEEANVFVFV